MGASLRPQSSTLVCGSMARSAATHSSRSTWILGEGDEQKPSRIEIDRLKSRFGAIAEALADVLTHFSLDLVAVVASYAACGSPKQNVVPQLLCWFGGAGSGPGQFKGVHTAAVSPKGGEIWVSDLHRVQVFDCDGRFLRVIAGEVKAPAGITFDKQANEAYIVDAGASIPFHRVCVYSCDSYAYLRGYGRFGDGDVQFRNPQCVALTLPHGSSRFLVVTDTGNSRAQILLHYGSFWRECKMRLWGHSIKPVGLAVTPGGALAVAANNVEYFDVHGRHVHTFDPFLPDGEAVRFLAFDDSGNLYTTLKNSNGVIVFGPNERKITQFDSKLMPQKSTFQPLGIKRFAASLHTFDNICIDETRRIYLADTSANRVLVCGFVED